VDPASDEAHQVPREHRWVGGDLWCLDVDGDWDRGKSFYEWAEHGLRHAGLPGSADPDQGDSVAASYGIEEAGLTTAVTGQLVEGHV